MFENPRRGRQARNFTTNAPKILDLKSSSAQIFSKNWRWVPLRYFSVYRRWGTKKCFTKGIKTLYCNSVGFCSLFFCIPIRIEIEKFIDCCAFSINWNILEQIFYFNSMIGLIEILHLFTFQFSIKIFQKWVRSIYNTTVVICGNIAAVSCLIHFKIDWHSSIIPIEWSDLSTVISNKSVSILLLTRNAVSKSKTISSYLSIYFGFLKDFIYY